MIKQRFAGLKTADIRIDNHIHSAWTDGEASVLEIAGEAEKMGLKQISIVDHVRENSTYFPGYYAEIKSIRGQFEMEILAGFEAKVKTPDGRIDVSKDVADMAQIRVVSVHRFPVGRKLHKPEEFAKEKCHKIELDLSIAAIKRGQFDVLGHPGGVSLAVHKAFPMEFFEEIIEECKKNDVVFELNSRYHWPVLKDLKVLLERSGVLVSIGSDAHSINDMRRSMCRLKELIVDE